MLNSIVCVPDHCLFICFTRTEHTLICIVAYGDGQQTGIRRINIYLLPYLSCTDSEELDQTAHVELSDQGSEDQGLPCLPFLLHHGRITAWPSHMYIKLL